VGSFDLSEKLCNETRFWKGARDVLANADNPDDAKGLFGAASEKEIDWQLAHRILMPAFGPLAIENMLDGESFCFQSLC
jgi:cytochrome P450/NADPH-cytochrome P450 reductase